jgi:uncharacterized protein (DUF433 family)
MASITIRNLDDEIKHRLRVRAAKNGRSLEEELRVILHSVAFGERTSLNSGGSVSEPVSVYQALNSAGIASKSAFRDEHGNEITINLDKRFGKPCINNTRIAVDDVLGWFASGMTMTEILADFPDLTKEQIQLALNYAASRQLKSITLP